MTVISLETRRAAAAGAPVKRPAPRAAAGVPPTAADGPPLVIPAAHFVLAQLFLIAGGLALAWSAPELARGTFLSPRVAAATHAFTIGWITLSIMGALYQLCPVVLSVPMRWLRLTWPTLVLVAAGVATFMVGLVTGVTAALVAGAAALSLGLIVFALHLLATLLRAPARDMTWWALAGAALALLATVTFGASLAGNVRWNWLGPSRLMALGVHVHVAIAGWVLLVVVAVARKLLPMFLLSHVTDERGLRASFACLAGGAALLSLLHHFGGHRTFLLAGLLLCGGVSGLLLQVAVWVRHRRRMHLDAGLRLAIGGMLLLSLATVIGAAAILLPLAGVTSLSSRALTLYGVLLVPGSLSLFVAGHHYKIVPFLVWLHRYGPRVGHGPVPTVAELISSRTSHLAAGLLLTGVIGAAFGVMVGSALLVRLGALTCTGGAVTLTIQLNTLLRRKT